MSDSLRPHGLYSPWNSPDQNTGIRSLSLLQGIFPTQGLNLRLLHYQLLIRGEKGCKGKAVKKQQCSDGAGPWFLLSEYTEQSDMYL